MIDYSDPIDGPWGLTIMSLRDDVEFEQMQLKWARDKLDFCELTDVQRTCYEWIAADAARKLPLVNAELEKWRSMHFSWLGQREGA